MMKRILARFRRSKSQAAGDIQTLIAQRDALEKPLDEAERELIASVLSFKDVAASGACVPRSDIVAISREITLDEVITVFKQSGFSRLPVYGKDLDDILGFVSLKDVVGGLDDPEHFALRKLLRPLAFVPENLPAPAVLTQMRAKRTHIAIVADEYGGTAGLVTAQDILEVLIGDWTDGTEQQHSGHSAGVTPLSGGRYQVDPRAEIDMLPLAMQQKFDFSTSGSYETVGGFILHLAGRVPETGEKITLPGGGTCLVTKSNGRKLTALTFIPAQKGKSDDIT